MAKPKNRKPPRPAKAPELPAAQKPYVGKHPADLILEPYEAQARKLLTAEGLPVDLAELENFLNSNEGPSDAKKTG
jgi:hypothetical protein